MEKICVLLFLLITGSFAMNLKYSDCDTDKASFHADSVKLNPYPVKIPGDFTPSGHLVLGHNITGNVELQVSFHKSLLFWVPVPCIAELGSCNYDFCDMLKTAFVHNGRTECPPQMAEQGLPCTCPFQAGSYTLNPKVWKIPELPAVLSWLSAGDYKIDAKLIDKSTRKQLGCYNIEMSFSHQCSGFDCIFG